jgi:S-DNA-T family DNA segregation ATPase FtsK/SpoIIIE
MAKESDIIKTMSRRRRRQKENPLDYLTLPSLGLDPAITKTIWALFILILAVVSGLSLFDSAGAAGVYLNLGLTWLFGWGRWLAPLILAAWAGFMLLRNRLAIGAVNYAGLVLFAVSLHGLMQLFINQDEWDLALSQGTGGGHFGWLVAWGLTAGVGLIAAYVILLVIFLISLMFIFNSTLATLWSKSSWPAKVLLHPVHFIWQKITGKSEAGPAETEEALAGEEVDEATADIETADDEEENIEAEEEADSRRPIVAMAKNEEIENIWHPNNIKIDLPLDLLSESRGKPVGADVKNSQKIIQKTLDEFGIEVEMGDVSVGPTVTQYTLRPADGIKLSRITNLNNDLAMALAAHPVRIEAPIPGKSLVGIEVPNKTIALVSLREILSNNEFKNRKTNNTIALGKDVAGQVWVADICKMPHLLVAGATGSGKSVMLNSIIVSLLYQNNPDDLRFILVDPKRVELTIYNGLPHLLTPVITEVSKTVNALKWSLNEMDRRFKILSKAGKRDIVSFNQTTKQKMPYIIFVIDELADLMLLAGKEVEAGVVRLAQMARAVGIHLILATQRPSVNVITGTIKANMPARIAFAVASSIDSRTILDGMGAEKLLGRGDMLFSDASMPKPKRLQGAFVGEKEIRRVVAEIKRQGGGVDYLDDVTDRQKVVGMAGVGMNGTFTDDEDDLVAEAKDIVVNAGKASATLLQRKLSVGYARAAKLLDILEEHGIIGPSQGSKPREILVSKEEFSALQTEAVSGMPLHKREEARPPAAYLMPSYAKATEDEEEMADEDEDEEEDGAELSEEFESEIASAQSLDGPKSAFAEILEEEEEPDEAEIVEPEEDTEEEVSEPEAFDEPEDQPKAKQKDDYDFDKYFSR